MEGLQNGSETRPSADAQPGPVRETSSAWLFGGAREVMIRHGGEVYRLRRTARGGLILTK
ncbi:MAG: hemin uptake protein HemP [Pseudomonadota bacterium]